MAYATKFSAALIEGQPQCQCCLAFISADGQEGRAEGDDSKHADLKCGCKYCWHCSDNRGRHEDHEQGCSGPVNDTGMLVTDWLRLSSSTRLKIAEELNLV